MGTHHLGPVALVKEELDVIATQRQAQEMAGYLVFEICRELQMEEPPRLWVDDCWSDPVNLIAIWEQFHPGESIDDWSRAGLGLRRITVQFKVLSRQDIERVLDEQMPELVKRVIGFADTQGIDLNHSEGANAYYFSTVSVVNRER